MQKILLLFLLGLVSIFPGCRPVSDNSSPESGSLVSDVDDIKFEETETPSNRYLWKPIIDYAHITSTTNHPENEEVVELLRSKGCSLSSPQTIHHSLGYPSSLETGNLSDEDFQLIAKLPNLVKIQISKQPFRPLNLTADAFRHIRHHPELRYILLSGVVAEKHFDDELFVYLADIPKLQQLSIRLLHLRGDSLKKLGELRGLKSLTLDGTYFENHDWAAMGQLSNLEELNLLTCYLEDEQIQFLPELKKLRRLDLYGNRRLTQQSMSILQKIPHLEALTLTHTGLSVSLDDIAAFPELRSLSLLDVQPEFTRSELKSRFPNLDYWEDD
ncbi:MAG: hypothetical protein HUJ26_07955 [Planctomycetaceae bacterium]|nr:hypothetical protein [Planctomycetaceae bacterium]